MDIHFDLPKITVYLPKGEYAVLSINGSTGNIEIAEDFSFESVDISISTGDVKLLADVSGDVKGSLRSEKIFLVETDTGKTDVPKTVNGGKCEIKTNTGNVQITIGD